ncbi:DUF5602 domain-containing protein [Azospirillum sp.]|uniref:DUF5602 domain-containing protein n=1 Tax=Azospirillum sp. TaxID=34012 RepID=UPI002D2A659D|nr:DUF5602 domain-containing protein [Azospirillum sp.]HYD70679.1 DUF5602 domain-containing protein [Azospirillum sp.]
MLIRTILVAGAFAMAANPGQAQNLDKAPPGGAYKKVSDLVKLPDFLPGMGTLYVDPKTLPAGPFLAYDRDGRLVSTIYMVPVEDIQDRKKLDNLKAAGAKVDHVDMHFNAGHPGVEKPHYHVVLWHVAEADEARVAK